MKCWLAAMPGCQVSKPACKSPVEHVWPWRQLRHLPTKTWLKVGPWPASHECVCGLQYPGCRARFGIP